jgi:hypothetical protein
MAQHNADATAALTGTISGVANVMGTVGAANIASSTDDYSVNMFGTSTKRED